MICDGSVGREAMRTAECVEEFWAAKGLGEESNVKFTFGVVATSCV